MLHYHLLLRSCTPRECTEAVEQEPSETVCSDCRSAACQPAHNTTPFYPGLIYFPKWLHFMWTVRKRSILGVKKKPNKPINLSDPHCYGLRGMFSKLLKAKNTVTAELWSGRGDRCCVAGLAHVWRGSWWVSNEFLHRLPHRQPPARASELIGNCEIYIFFNFS